MEPDKYLLGLLVFVVVLIGGVWLIGDYNSNYGYTGNTMSTDDFEEINTATQQLYGDSQEMKDNLVGGEVDQQNTLDSMYLGAYRSLRLVTGSFSIVGNIINTVAIKVGIPAPFVAIAFTALIIAVVFGILYIIFRR
jgi:hypothetical protein